MKKELTFAALVLAAAACSAQNDAPGGEAAAATVGTPSGNTTPPAAPGGGAAAAPATAGEAYAGADAAHVTFRMVDAPTDEVTAIVVTVSKVDAKLPSGWTTLVDKEQTVDLLTLQGGEFLNLGAAALAPGRVGQVRLRLVEGGDHHVVTPDGVVHPLTIPSGEASGIKLVGGFTVPPCGAGHVTMDFDGKRSLQVEQHGKNASTWKLRPVIRLKSVVIAGECAEAGAPPPDGSDEAGAPLPEDSCAQVTCTEAEVCDNGTCKLAE